MDVVAHHGTLQVHVAPARRLGFLAALATLVAFGSLMAMLVEPVRSDPAWMPALAAVALLAAGAMLVLKRLLRDEVLQIGLFVRTGSENGTVTVRTSDLLAVGKEEAPAGRSASALLAAVGAGAGRLRLHTSRGDFLFGAGLSDDDLTRLVWRLTPVCRHNLRPRGNPSHHLHK